MDNMSENKLKIELSGFDPLGAKAWAETTKPLVEASIETGKAFLSLICKPALEELGLLIKDKVQSWRLNNILKLLEKAEGKIVFDGKSLRIHPRIALEIMEIASVTEEEDLQEMWAGLFASSLTGDGADTGNLYFINILKQLTGIQVRMIDYSCTNAPLIAGDFRGPRPNGRVLVNVPKIMSIAGTEDLLLIERELTYLKVNNLMYRSPDFADRIAIKSLDDERIELTPTHISMQLYAKCHCGQDDYRSFFKPSNPLNL